MWISYLLFIFNDIDVKFFLIKLKRVMYFMSLNIYIYIYMTHISLSYFLLTAFICICFNLLILWCTS